MKKERYIFDEWIPNPQLLIGSALLYVYLILTLSWKDGFIIALASLSLGWAFSFSKPMKKEKKK